MDAGCIVRGEQTGDWIPPSKVCSPCCADLGAGLYFRGAAVGGQAILNWELSRLESGSQEQAS